MADYGDDMLLGKVTAAPDAYAPDVLYPIPRAPGRRAAGIDSESACFGVDLWHAYELSWLDEQGKPEVRVGRISIPADSPNMVESKSLKLYLNSLNNLRHGSADAVATRIRQDVGGVVGCEIGLELLPVTAPELCGEPLSGDCIDHLGLRPDGLHPDCDLLVTSGRRGEDTVHSHLLRSLCPVTGQPDWASVWIHYRGDLIERASLLQYIIAFRQHQEFHEQCVERMFADIGRRSSPDFLHIQAFYTRRGGLDINPMRSTVPGARPLPRMNRQ